MKNNAVKRFLRENYIIAVVVIALVVMTCVKSHYLTAHNISNIFSQVAIFGIVSAAMTISIIGGEFDLSVGSMMGMISLFFARMVQTNSVFGTILFCIFLGIVCGAFNGVLVGIVKISSFVATLSTMMVFKGIALTYCNSSPISFHEDVLFNFASGSWLGIPIPAWFFFLFLILAGLLLRHTRFGRDVYATGGSYEVAKLAGVNVVGVKIMLFVILGFCTAVASILLACKMNSGNALYGDSLTMTAVTGVVIGGSSLSGGKGDAFKTFWGMVFMGILFNALLRLQVDGNWQNVITGAILIAVITIDALMRLKRAKRVRS